MSDLLWQLTQREAHLELPTLRARIDLYHPERGLGDVVFQGQPVTGQQALGVQPGSVQGGEAAGTECYVRGADLVATYARDTQHPLRVQAYWRIVAADQLPPDAAGIDLVVSVQTSAWETASELSASTSVQSDHFFRLADGVPPSPKLLEVRSGANATLLPAEGPGCLAFQLGPRGPMYAEMIHPADFHRDELTAGPVVGTVTRLTHGLFGHTLEKGVILRARVRGVWMLEEGFEAAVATAYAAFVESPAPLTT